MLTKASLSALDMKKVRPGLMRSLRIATRYPSTPFRELINRWIGPKRGHLFIEHLNGNRYWILEEDVPAGWTGRHWISFVVMVVRFQSVVQAGTFDEPLFGIPRIPFKGTRVRSYREFLRVAERGWTPPSLLPIPGHDMTGIGLPGIDTVEGNTFLGIPLVLLGGMGLVCIALLTVALTQPPSKEPVKRNST